MASELHACEYIPGRLYYVPLGSNPSTSLAQKHHFFSIDQELVYWNFFYDFGPLNLGQLYRFCTLLNQKLADPRMKDKIIYFYSGTHANKKANASFLIGAWAIIYLEKTAEEAFRPVRNVGLPLWHDATNTACTFPLTVLDTLKGLEKAMKCKFFNFQNFDIEEYEFFEQVENGDLNWCMDGKFIAFAGPHATRDAMEGYRALTPDDYSPYFKKKNVTLVVRLNKKYYDARRFLNAGIDHLDLYYLDGSVPPAELLNRFITKCEETPGAVAVHCKAGLGRTGTCIGCYIMKHFKFTAEEIIGWLRIVRPGSVIGPQQQFMKDVQQRMWREGDVYRARLHTATAATATASSISTTPTLSTSNNNNTDRNADKDIGSETDSKDRDSLSLAMSQLSVSPQRSSSIMSNNNTISSISNTSSSSSATASPSRAHGTTSASSSVPLPLIPNKGSTSTTSSTSPSIVAESKSRDRERYGNQGTADIRAKDRSYHTNTAGGGTSNGGGSSAKEQGDLLRMRRQQMVDEQARSALSNTSPAALSLASPPSGSFAVSAPGTAPGSRSAGFTSRFLSSWKK